MAENGDTFSSFRARLVVELLEFIDMDGKGECATRVYVNTMKRKTKNRFIKDGKVKFTRPEVFTFGGDEKSQEIVTLDDFLRIQVFAKDAVWKREIGAMEVRLGEMIKPEISLFIATDWIRLRNLEGKEVGKILLRLSYSGSDLNSNLLDPLHDIDAIYPVQNESAPLFGNALFRASIDGKSLFPMVNRRWLLRIRIHACRDLRVADTLPGTSDPFCEIKARGETKYTDAVFRDLNPVFPPRVIVFGEGLDVLNSNDDILVTVFDYDRLKKADFLGSIKAPIWAICNSDFKPVWYELCSEKATTTNCAGFQQYPEDARTHGRILISAEFVKPDDLAAKKAENLPFTIPGTFAQPDNVGFESSASKASVAPPVATKSSIIDVAEARSREAVELYKPYKGKIWLYRMEVTVLGIRSHTSQIQDYAVPLVPGDEGPLNVLHLGGRMMKSNRRSAPVTMPTTLPDHTPSKPISENPGHEPTIALSKRSTDPVVTLAQRLSRKMFCELRCGCHVGARLRTKTCRDTHNPSWRGDTFVCAGIDHKGMRVENASLGVALMTRNGIGQDYVLGTCVLDLERVCRDMGYIDLEGMALTDWFDLRAPNLSLAASESAGSICALQLRIVLKPINQTRVSWRQSLAVRLENCTGLKVALNSESGGKSHSSKVFVRARLVNTSNELVEVKESSVSTVHRNGEAHFDQLLVFDHFVPECMKLGLVLVDFHSGEEFGRTTFPHACTLTESTDEGWEMALREDHQEPYPIPSVSPNKSFFRLGYRKMAVQSRRFLPVLGTMSLRLHSLRLSTHDFKHDVRIVVQYGTSTNVMCTKTYKRDVNITFDPSDSKFELQVRNPHEEVEIQIRDLYGVSSHAANASPWAGKFIARYTMTCFDVIESEFSQNSAEPRLALPVQMSSKADPGLLEISLRYDETLSALLSRNANPLQVPIPPFSITRSAKELQRFARVLAWPWVLQKQILEILNWTNPVVTIAYMVLLVLFCTIPVWSERPLIIIPLVLLVYLGINYRKRMDGRFIAAFITQTGSGVAHSKHASLKVCVIKAKNIFAPDLVAGAPKNSVEIGATGRHGVARRHSSSFTFDPSRARSSGSVSTSSNVEPHTEIKPVFRIKILDLAAMEQTTIGHSLALDRPTRQPDWSYRPANAFRSARGSTLISWRAGLHDHVSRAGPQEDHVRFNVKTHQAFLCAVQRKEIEESVLVMRLHRIRLAQKIPKADDYRMRVGPRDGGDAKFKTSREVPADQLEFEEDIVIEIEPDEPLLFAFGRTGDFFNYATCEIDDPFRQPHHSPMSFPLIVNNWPTDDNDVSHSGTFRFQSRDATNSSQNPRVLGYIDLEFLYFGDPPAAHPIGGLNGSVINGAASSLSHGESNFGLRAASREALPNQTTLEASADGSEVDDDWNFLDNEHNPNGTDGSLHRLARSLTGGITNERHVSIPKKDFEQASKASIQSWRRQAQIIVIELHDKSVKGRFLGRAVLPLYKLVSDMDSLEQPTFHDWLKLEPVFDGTSNDRSFFRSYDGQGSIFVSAQITLPIPADETALKEEQQAKKARFPHEKLEALRRQAERVYRDARAFNDRMERIKNTFNWAVVSRTRLVLSITLVLFLLFAIVPSRLVVLVVGLYLFTERFRAHGVVVIAVNHLIALAPTDENFARVVSREIFGRTKRKLRTLTGQGSSPNASSDDEEDDEAEDEVGEEETDLEGKLMHADARFKRAIMQVKRVIPKVSLRHKRADRRASETLELLAGHLEPSEVRPCLQRRLGSVAQGYLRVLERHVRGLWFRRYFFTFDGSVMQYWLKRQDFLNHKPSLGRLTSINSCQQVLADTPEASLAAKNDALKIDCLFVVRQNSHYNHLGSATSGVGSTFGSLFRRDILDGKTLFAANSQSARDTWIRAFQRSAEDVTASVDADDEVY